VDLQSVKISSFATVIFPVGAACGRFWIDSAPVNLGIIADLDRAAIDEENVLGTGHSVKLAEPFEKCLQNRIQRVEPPVKSVSAEPPPEVGRAFEQVLGGLEVAAEKASGHDRAGHHLPVGDLPLGTFRVATGSEPIVGEAVDGNDNGVHGTGSLRDRN